MWCGVPLIQAGAPLDFEPIKTEVEYLDGFERLDGPATVALSIGPEGVELKELMPGSRSVMISTESIISARVTGPLKRVGSVETRPSGWLRLKAGGQQPEQHRSALTLRYRDEDGTEISVVFERLDSVGADVLKRIGRTISLLIRLKAEQSSN